jgi:hypothetical protein
MAAITVTSANVQRAIAQLGLPGSSMEMGRFGATVTAGQAVYRDSSDSYDLKLAIATSAAAAAVYGIALNGGADGQPAEILRAGLYNPGGTVVVGQLYCVSAAAAGAIVPYGDLATLEYVSFIGVGITAALIYVNFTVSGIAKP